MELNIGTSQENREAISAGLARLLADSYAPRTPGSMRGMLA
jgi:hypothetical protein